MINKKLSVLAAAVFAASASQASFEQGNAVFIAVDLSTENQARYVTTVVDLGVTAQSIYNGSSFGTVNVGSNHSAWTILGVVEGTVAVTGTHPSPNPSLSPTHYEDNGIIVAGTGTVSTKNGSNAANASADLQANLASWIAGIAALDTTDSGTVTTTNSQAEAFNQGMLTWGHDYGGGNALNAVGMVNVNGVIERTEGGSPPNNSGNWTMVLNGGLNDVTYDASTGIVSAVPVPAAAWLFGSALAGLTLARRRK